MQRIMMLIDLPGRLIFDLPLAIFNRYQWLIMRPLVVVGALGLCFVAGYLVAQQPIERVTIIVAGAIGALLLLVSFYRMAWGLTMFLFVSLWVRFSLSTGTQSPLVASLLLAIALVVLWMLRMFLFEKRVGLPPSRITVVLLLFGGVALLSFVWSNSFPDPMVVMNGMWPRSFNTRVATLMVVLASVGIALLTSRHFQEERWYRITVVMFVIAGFQGAVVSLGQALGVFSVQGIPILGDLNTFGLFRMWVVAFCLGQVFFNRGLNWRYKAFMVLISVLWFYYSFFIVGNWLSGWAVLLVITLVMTALRSPRLLLVFLLLLMVWALFNLEMFEEMFAAESEESGSTRLEAWNTNILMTNGHWFLGTGPAGYAAYYLTYIPNDAMATHSNYIDVLAQFGLVGLSIMVVLLLSVMWKGFKAFRAIPGGGFLKGFAASMVAASVGFTFAMALGDWVIPFPYTQGIVAFGHTVWCWMAMGTIAALEYKYRDRAKPRQRPERPRPDDAHDAKKSLTAGVN